MMARGARSVELGEALRVERQIFQWWPRVRDGTLAHASFRTYMQPIRWEVERLLKADQDCGVPKTEGTCREIFKRRQALGTFVRHEGESPRTTPPRGPFVLGYCGAKAVLTPKVRRGPGSSKR